MRKSNHQQNSHMLQAYQTFQKGDLKKSIQQYEGILKNITQNPTNANIRANITVSIAVISMSIGNYNYALDILQKYVSGYNFEQLFLHNSYKFSVYTYVRIISNLIFLRLIHGAYEDATNLATKLCSQIKLVIRSNKKIINSDINRFLMGIFFRVEEYQDLQKFQISQKFTTSNISMCFYALNIAYCQMLSNMGNPKKILKTIYPILIDANIYKLAIVCLRQLLKLQINSEQQEYFESEINRLIQNGHYQSYDLDDTEAVNSCKSICQKILQLNKQLTKQLTKQISNSPQNKQIRYKQIRQQQIKKLWKIIINYQQRNIKLNQSIDNQQKQILFRNIQILKKQSNTLVIKQMQKLDFYINSLRNFQNTFNCSLIQTIIFKLKSNNKYAFKKIKQNMQLPNKVLKIIEQTNQDENATFRSRTISASKISKISENLSLLPSYKNSETPHKDKSLRQIQNVSRPKYKNHAQKIFSNISPSRNKNTKLKAKMLRYCECGSFLSKRNYNSDGGEYKFVRLTNAAIKWAKNPQKLDNDCQLYPLKDIRSIHYGKSSPNLLKQSNNLLNGQYCFSLLLQKRTLDFHCANSDQARNWVCGISQKMKKIKPEFKGYSHGKFLWMKMFMKLRKNFTQKLRAHQKNYYYETAQAIILFGQNNYQLLKSN